jgi:hypothetical protein
VTLTNLRHATGRSVLRNFLLAASMVTLAMMVPLNSLILSHPQEWRCLSCLLTAYAVSVAGLTLWLCVTRAGL